MAGGAQGKKRSPQLGWLVLGSSRFRLGAPVPGAGAPRSGSAAAAKDEKEDGG